MYVVPKSHVTTTSTDNSTSTVYYKVPRPSQSSSGSDDDRILIHSGQAFSPDHYEMGPLDDEEIPVYENTDFDHPFDPSEGVIHETVYQNTSFTGAPLSSINSKLALKKTASPQQKKKPAPPPNKPKAHKSPKSTKELDDEYINPEEFSIAEDDKPNKPTITGKIIFLNLIFHMLYINNLSFYTKCILKCMLFMVSNHFASIVGTDSTPGRVKYVSILTTNPAASFTTTTSNENTQSHQKKPKLIGSKSFNLTDRSTSSEPEDEEYIAMDPVYAAVAPDEPDYEESDSKYSLLIPCYRFSQSS